MCTSIGFLVLVPWRRERGLVLRTAVSFLDGFYDRLGIDSRLKPYTTQSDGLYETPAFNQWSTFDKIV